MRSSQLTTGRMNKSINTNSWIFRVKSKSLILDQPINTPKTVPNILKHERNQYKYFTYCDSPFQPCILQDILLRCGTHPWTITLQKLLEFPVSYKTCFKALILALFRNISYWPERLICLKCPVHHFLNLSPGHYNLFALPSSTIEISRHYQIICIICTAQGTLECDSCNVDIPYPAYHYIIQQIFLA
jgi:hypothetical protein